MPRDLEAGDRVPADGTLMDARGAMLDELRANDWLPRSARKSQRDIEGAIHRLEGRLMRAPVEAEIAAELGLPMGTVKSRIRLAFAKLRAALEERA